MTTFTDRYGYELTTGSAATADAFVHAIDAILAYNSGAEDALREALRHDPAFALAHITLARQLQVTGNIPEATREKEAALTAASSATRREQQHVAAIVRAMDGDGSGATEFAREHLAEYPRDAYLLLQVSGPFGLIAFNGSPDWRAETFAIIDPLAKSYGDDWWFLNTHAFVHNELNHFEVARTLAQRSLDLFVRQGSGAHTMSHVLFEAGDASGGDAFLAGWLPGYERNATIYSHLAWHHALFLLKEGRAAGALAIYAKDLAPDVYPGSAVISIADAASFMWRCDLYGVDRPEASRAELRDFAAKTFPKPGITFADLHCALAYAAAGDGESLEHLVGGLRQREAEGKQPAGPIVAATAEAIRRFANRDYAGAVDALYPVREMVVRIGGSNAQREVFEDTLLEACMRAGRFEQAEPVLRERLERRPSASDQTMLGRVVAAATPK
ncbi:MAG: tetratricopeptide repeat protein [Dehalococcoidia bacterium]|nr:tetratricopeptide repeat protein [Dehalococcoidia bacterium]